MNVAKKSKLEIAGCTVGIVAESPQLSPCEAEMLEASPTGTHITMEQAGTIACSKDALSTCPCCGTTFSCAPGFPFACDCRNVRLTPEDRNAFYARFVARCLCKTCLIAAQSKP